jgi:solute carrier family 13 (sodium-dependent dicarboxylate transporter), member 2/3/5
MKKNGFWLGLFLFIITLLLPHSITGEMEPAAIRTAALALLMATWWITEALPIPATAMLPLALVPIMGLGPFKGTAAPYAHPIIFLFLGGFLIAIAMQRWNLHRRIALNILNKTGTKPAQLIAGFMLATALLSMWVSNTATTMMMLPIGISVVEMIRKNSTGISDAYLRNFGIALMLAIAYSANIGGMGTTVGTFPNALMAAYMSDQLQTEISMAEWMGKALPIVFILLPCVWILLTRVIFPVGNQKFSSGGNYIKEELVNLGSMSREEKIVAVIFLMTGLMWVFRPVYSKWLPTGFEIKDGGIAIFASLLLFIIPAFKDGKKTYIIEWEQAKFLPWDLLLIIGGGLSLASAIKNNGLSNWIGGLLEGSAAYPQFVVISLVILTIVFLTEITSNTATTAVFLPVMGALAIKAKIDPMVILFPATIAASCAFMLPVATPPNAIVYGSGLFKSKDMLRAGLYLNVAATIILAIYSSLVLA